MIIQVRQVWTPQEAKDAEGVSSYRRHPRSGVRYMDGATLDLTGQLFQFPWTVPSPNRDPDWHI